MTHGHGAKVRQTNTFENSIDGFEDYLSQTEGLISALLIIDSATGSDGAREATSCIIHRLMDLHQKAVSEVEKDYTLRRQEAGNE